MQAQTLPIPQSADFQASIMQILILDDSEIDRTRIFRLCKDAGLTFEATEAASLDDMRQALSARQFDIVFVDYLLTNEDGLDAINLLNEFTEQNAVSIMIAGEGQIGVAVEAMRRGCSDYLTKSELSVAGLQKSIATAIERQAMGLSLNAERAKRLALETAVRQYAQTCSAEMRSILSGTLRRLRSLRSETKTPTGTVQLGALEDTLDQLWDVLPNFSAITETIALGNDQAERASAPDMQRPH